ncbi:unnamed protein product [Larinioides sclopetarius]|uniref:EGF-like domain-containing protein n=1 Tax=Larinioides sclopetarius TaxID=280406 RepID=A0AAV2BX15_9ARAC
MKMNKDPHGKIDIISTPSVCLPFSDDLYCLIPPEFVTRKRRVDGAKVFHKTDPCDKGVIEKLCGKETTCKVSELGLTCKCKSGYFKIISFVPVKNVEVDVCGDVDECRNSTICPNTTTCSNLPGDYTCRCIDGYSLEEGKSVKRDGCTRIILKGDKATEIVGGTLGIFLVVTIIVCIILFRRLQKQNSVDDAEEYVQQGMQGHASEMRRLDQRKVENNDVQFRENEQNSNFQYPIKPIYRVSNSRSQLGNNSTYAMSEEPESCNNTESYTRDVEIFHRSHYSGHFVEEDNRKIQGHYNRQKISQKPLSKSFHYLYNEPAGVSRVDYRNRGYEED